MATATLTNTPIPIEVPVETTVTLTLTGEEAIALKIVLNHIGGNPDTTPRGHIESIHNALKGLGIGGSRVERDRPLLTSSPMAGLYFTKEANEVLREELKKLKKR
jgi:hypothetical protein